MSFMSGKGNANAPRKKYVRLLGLSYDFYFCLCFPEMKVEVGVVGVA